MNHKSAIAIGTLLLAFWSTSNAQEKPALSERLRGLQREIGRWQMTIGPRETGGFVGIGFVAFTEKQAEALKLKHRPGIFVAELVDDGPAGKAGVRKDDVITELAGMPVSNLASWRTAAGATQPGQDVVLKLYRRDKEMEVPLKLGNYPARGEVQFETVVGALGHSIVSQRPRITDLAYFDAALNKIVRISVTAAGATGRTLYSPEDIEKAEYTGTTEIVFADGKRGNHVEHFKWAGPDQYTHWTTDRSRDGEKLPELPVATFKRVKQ